MKNEKGDATPQETGYETIDSVSEAISGITKIEKLDPQLPQTVPRTIGNLGLTNSEIWINPALVFGGIFLVGGFSLKYFVRPANLRRKRIALGLMSAVMSVNTSLYFKEVALSQDASSIQDSDEKAIWVPTLVFFIDKPLQDKLTTHALPKTHIDLYKDVQATLDMAYMAQEKRKRPDIDEELRRILNMTFGPAYKHRSRMDRIFTRVQDMWSSTNTKTLVMLVIMKSLLEEGVYLSDTMLCVTHLSNACESGRWETIEHSATWVGTGAFVTQIFANRPILVRLSGGIGIASLFVYLFTGALRRYQHLYTAENLIDKSRVAAAYRKRFKEVIEEWDKLVAHSGIND